MKILFFGTQDWSAEILRQLIVDDFFEIVAVVTQPDQKTPSLVKKVAEAASISLLQPTNLKDPIFLQKIQNVHAEIAVVIAYGRILPPELLSLIPRGFVNVHPSLLPKWRGPSPVQAAIAAGDHATGITIMLIDAKMDHGPILAQREILLSENSTFTGVMEEVTQKAPNLLIQTMKDFVSHKLIPRVQDHTTASYCKLLKREDGRIDWNRSAIEIERRVRAYEPWPGSWTMGQQEGRLRRFKLLQVMAHEHRESQTPGMLFQTGSGIFVGTTKGILEILTIQPEGKKALSADDFARGYKNLFGTRFDGNGA